MTCAYAHVILARNDEGSWDLIEVKSSTSVRDQYVDDVAIQLVTLERAGVKIANVGVAHIDRSYVYEGGAHVPSRLFTIVDVTKLARKRLAEVPARLEEMRTALASDDRPSVDIGSHCRRPYRCQFFEYCRQDEPDESVEEIPGLAPARLDAMLGAGFRSLATLPAEVPLNPLQTRVRDAVRSRNPWIGANLGELIGDLASPLHFVDFETISPWRPIFAGTRPYEAPPFQWSDHVLHSSGAVRHASFLATGVDDPRREFVESLCEQLDGAGTLVVYSNYEETQLRALTLSVPDLEVRLQSVLSIPRLDLLQVIRAGYYHPDFRGSFSLKAVLPVLVPELGYSDLAIQGGGLASFRFMQTLDGELDDDTRQQIREDLLAYCSRDTEALLRILDALRGIAATAAPRPADGI